MQLITLTTLTTLFLLIFSANAGFTLKDDKKWYGTGCSLKVDDVCGCSKKVNINHVYACEDLPDTHTHGNVCGGHWTLWTARNKHNHQIVFTGKNRSCGKKCYLGGLKSGSKCD